MSTNNFFHHQIAHIGSTSSPESNASRANSCLSDKATNDNVRNGRTSEDPISQLTTSSLRKRKLYDDRYSGFDDISASKYPKFSADCEIEEELNFSLFNTHHEQQYFDELNAEQYFALDSFKTDEVITSVQDNATIDADSYAFSQNYIDNECDLVKLPPVFDDNQLQNRGVEDDLFKYDARLGSFYIDDDTATTFTNSSDSEREIYFSPQTEAPDKRTVDEEREQSDFDADILSSHEIDEDDEEYKPRMPVKTPARKKAKHAESEQVQTPLVFPSIANQEPNKLSNEQIYEQTLKSLMTSDSLHSPYQKELTPSERNDLITNEMNQFSSSAVHTGHDTIAMMILSPERNRHNTFDIPRKNIASMGNDNTLKIGSGSEKKFKYFLHVMFKTKQTSLPKLELVKEDDMEPITNALRVHQSQLLANGMIARYSMSFLVNSFEHERKSFHLLVKEPETDKVLVKSVPFKLNARKTNDCLFHMRTQTATPSKKKKKTPKKE